MQLSLLAHEYVPRSDSEVVFALTAHGVDDPVKSCQQCRDGYGRASEDEDDGENDDDSCDAWTEHELSGGRVEDAVEHGVIASDKIAGSGDFYGVAHYWIPFEFGLKEPSCVSRVYQRNRLITIGFRFLTKFLAFSDNTEDAD